MEDIFSDLVSERMADKTPMTVGAGLMCDALDPAGPCIILAVDDKGSYGNPPLTSNNACGKFHDLLPLTSIAIAMSGTISTCDAVIAEFYKQLENTRDERRNNGENESFRQDDFRNAIREARRYEYRLFVEEELDGYLGMSLDEWQKETHPEKKRKGLAITRAARMYFPCFLIIGGFFNGHWHLQKSSGATVTEVGAQHYTTGCGEFEALQQLNKRTQDPEGQIEYLSPPRALLHLAEAMEAARIAHPKTIGYPAAYVVIRKDGQVKRFPSDSQILKDWIAQFDGRSSLPMQHDRTYRKQFESALLAHQSPNV